MAARLLLCLTSGLVLLAAGHAAAQTRWLESQAVVDEVVADTVTPAPTSTLTPLVTQTPFDNLRYPHVDAQQNVTFIADDTFYGSKGVNHGVWRSPAGGTLTCLVRGNETLVPGSTAKLKQIRGLQMDDDGVDFVFNAFDTGGGQGLYHWSQGRLDTVARAGETYLPGEKGPLTDVEYGALQGNHVLYQGSVGEDQTVLVLHNLATGTDRVLCRTGAPLPGRQADTFHFIYPQNWLTADSVIFRTVNASGPKGENIKGTSGVYGWFGVQDWSGASRDLSAGRMQTVVNGTTPVPTADAPAGATFDDIASTPIQGNLTAFEASGKGFDGIFYATVPGGPLRTVVDNKTEMEGLFPGHFTSFGIWPTVIGQNVIFTASAASPQGGRAYTGVFLYRADRDELYVLADNRTPLEGKTIRSFEIAGHFLSNNRFAVTAKFFGGSQGVYLATIPTRVFRRMNGDTAAAATGR